MREFEVIGKGLEKGLERVRVFRVEVERNQREVRRKYKRKYILLSGFDVDSYRDPVRVIR